MIRRKSDAERKNEASITGTNWRRIPAWYEEKPKRKARKAKQKGKR